MAISRRQFVVGGAAAGAGALVIGVRLSGSLLRAQESAEEAAVDFNTVSVEQAETRPDI